MDPNTNPLGAVPLAPNPATTPEPAVPEPAAAAPAAPAAGLDALSDLGNLANELNNYDPAADLQAMSDAAPAAAPAADVSTTPVADVSAAPIAPDAAAPETAAPVLAPTDPALAAPVAEPAPAMDAPVAEPAPESAPVLQPSADLVADLAAAAPAEEASPLLQPSADLTAVSTVSASPNGMPPSPLDNIQPLAPENPTATAPVTDDINPVNPDAANPEGQGGASTDFNSDSSLAANAEETESLKGKKVKAAAPVPGSIGSMKSYIDIQREEAERAAKAAALEAAKQNGKKPLNTTTILIAAAAAVVAIIVAVVMIFSFTGGSGDETVGGGGGGAGGGGDDTDDTQTSILLCSIPMRPEEFAGMPGVLSAKRVNTFEFKDDILASLKTEQIYYMDSAQSATNAKLGFDAEHPEVRNAGELNEPAVSDDEEDEEEDEEEEEVNPNDRYSMENITTTAKGATYTFTRYISEDLIEAWLDSKFYSDVEYGLSLKNPNNPEESRTIDGYKAAQNSLNYTCTVTEQ